ncbi:AAA family ATPase [Eggerthellaceae bacterium zg-893]|nr:AAA family ATPase [Eggerthellaceae bacterium zg-893]
MLHFYNTIQEGRRMATNSTIRLLLEDFHRSVLPTIARELVPRDLSLGSIPRPKIGSTAKVIVGMRRSGKTFRLYQEMLRLLDNGVAPENICYLNFDDDRLRPYNDASISQAIEVFYELHPQSRSDGAYLFFDEIQEVPNWGIVARRILDTEKVALYVTGSSSKLLSEDVATEFRGRSVAYELLPYSFREFLRARDLEPSERDLYDKECVSAVKNAFGRYLKCGGFPAVQDMDDLERIQALQGYAQLTVARDIVERNGFSNAAYARNLARAAITSSARDVSISRLDNKGRSSGYSPGRAKIVEMLDAFEDAHLVYQAYDFSYSAQKVRLGGMKLYAADPGLYWASIPAADEGHTFSLETAVYLELRRRRTAGRLGDIAMLKLASGREVDFVEGDASMESATRLVQASWSTESEKTREREIRALREALERFPSAQATIVAVDEEGTIETPEGNIAIVPAWKWFLEAPGNN